MHSACTFPAVKSSETGAITQGADAPLHIFTAWHTCRFFIVIRLPASSATRFATCPCRLARKSVGANKRPLTGLKGIPPRESPPRSGFYQMFRRFSLGMYRESFSVILKASYHASMCGKAPFTRHSPSECGSLLVRLRISSSRMLAAHTLA